MQTDTGVSRQLEAPTESAAPDFHQISTIPPHLKPSDTHIFISTLMHGISSTRPLPVPFTFYNHLSICSLTVPFLVRQDLLECLC